MRAKSEIFTVSPKTFRAKVQTSYDKEEKTSQHALYGPHLLIKEDIPEKCSCRIYRYQYGEYISRSQVIKGLSTGQYSSKHKYFSKQVTMV